jgi:hypothetical protein
MVTWVLAGWFAAEDVPNFGVVQGAAVMMIIALGAARIALWPTLFTRQGKQRWPSRSRHPRVLEG